MQSEDQLRAQGVAQAKTETQSDRALRWSARTGAEVPDREAAILDELGIGPEATSEMLADGQRAVRRIVDRNEAPTAVFDWFKSQHPEAAIAEERLPLQIVSKPTLSEQAASRRIGFKGNVDMSYSAAALIPGVAPFRALTGQPIMKWDKEPTASTPQPASQKLASAVPMLPSNSETRPAVRTVTQAVTPGQMPDGEDQAFGQMLPGPVSWVFDQINRPYHAVANVIRNAELASIGLEPFNPHGVAWEGLTLARRDTMADVWQDYGVEDPFLLFSLSLASDIPIDPLTWLGGSGLIAKAATKVSHGVFMAARAGEKTLTPALARPLMTAHMITRMAKRPTSAPFDYYRPGNEPLLEWYVQAFDKQSGLLNSVFHTKKATQWVNSVLKDLEPDEAAAVMAVLARGEKEAISLYPGAFRARAGLGQMADKLEMTQQEARQLHNAWRTMPGEAPVVGARSKKTPAGWGTSTETLTPRATPWSQPAQTQIERMRNLLYKKGPVDPKTGKALLDPKTGMAVNTVRRAVTQVEKFSRDTIEPMLRAQGLERFETHYLPTYWMRHLSKQDYGRQSGPFQGLSRFFARVQGRHIDILDPDAAVRAGVSSKRMPPEFYKRELPRPLPGDPKAAPGPYALGVRHARGTYRYQLEVNLSDTFKQWGRFLSDDDIIALQKSGFIGSKTEAAREVLKRSGFGATDEWAWEVMEVGEASLKKMRGAKPDTLWGKTRDALEAGSGVKAGQYMAVPKPVARTLETMLNPEKMGDFLRFYDMTQNWFKRSVTVWWPLFHTRNGMSNVFLNWMGGVTDPFTYAEAFSFMRGKRGGKIYGVKGVGQWSGDAVQEAMDGSGLTKSGLVQDFQHHFGTTDPTEAERLILRNHASPSIFQGKEYARALSQAKGWERVRLMIDGIPIASGVPGVGYGTRGPSHIGTTVGSWIEDHAKVTHVLAKLEKGMNLDEAIGSAKHWLYDYRAMSPGERKVARRVIPFYAWQRNNIPRMLEALFQQPQKFAQTNHFMRNATGAITLAAGPEEQAQAAWFTAMPDFMARIGGWIWGVDEFGSPKILRGTFGLPFEDLRAVLPFVNFGDWFDHFLSMTTPIAGVLTSLMGYSTFTGESTKTEGTDQYYRYSDQQTAWLIDQAESSLKFVEDHAPGPIATLIRNYREENLGVTRESFTDRKGNKRTSYIVKNPAWYATMISMVAMLGTGRAGSTVKRWNDPRKTWGEKLTNFLSPAHVTSFNVTRRAGAYWAGESGIWDAFMTDFDVYVQAMKNGDESVSIERLSNIYSAGSRAAWNQILAMRKGLLDEEDRSLREGVRKTLLDVEQLAIEAYLDGDPAWKNHPKWAPGSPPLTSGGVPDFDRFYAWRRDFVENPYERIRKLKHVDGRPYIEELRNPEDIKTFNENVKFQLEGRPTSMIERAETAGFPDVGNFAAWRQYAYDSYGIYRDPDQTPRWTVDRFNAQAKEIEKVEQVYRVLRDQASKLEANDYKTTGTVYERVGADWKPKKDASGNIVVDKRAPVYLAQAKEWDRLYESPARKVYRARHPELYWFGLGGIRTGPTDPSIMFIQPPPVQRPALPNLPPPTYSRPGMEQQFSGTAAA
jgi:hypothetical protein